MCEHIPPSRIPKRNSVFPGLFRFFRVHGEEAFEDIRRSSKLAVGEGG